MIRSISDQILWVNACVWYNYTLMSSTRFIGYISKEYSVQLDCNTQNSDCTLVSCTCIKWKGSDDQKTNSHYMHTKCIVRDNIITEKMLLTLSTLGKIFSRHFETFFLFFPENRC